MAEREGGGGYAGIAKGHRKLAHVVDRGGGGGGGDKPEQRKDTKS